MGIPISSRSRTLRVSLPRPKGTRRTSRAVLTVSMHPAQLAAIRACAIAASMSPTAYLGAVLFSDVICTPEERVNCRVGCRRGD